jgi:hypothetical protein
MERVTTSKWIYLVNKSSFEVLIGQYQQETDKILCVKDGTDLLIYNDGSEIPQYLKRVCVRTQSITSIKEYNFRSTDDSLYVFFDAQVHDWIVNGRQGTLKLTFKGNVSTVIVTAPPAPPPREIELSTASETLSGRTVNIPIEHGAAMVVERMNIDNTH